jgi:transcriptional regulator GlxA family with amidase domain
MARHDEHFGIGIGGVPSYSPVIVDLLPAGWQTGAMFRSVAALVLPQVAPFELGAICEVFGVDRQDDGVPGVDFALVTEHPGLVATSAGFSVDIASGLDRADRADVLVVPAPGPDAAVSDAVTGLLRRVVARGGVVLSVCTGAFVLGAAGLLDDRHCTTHWMHTEELARRYPKARVDPAVLYVDAGQVITSAGTAASIDACLHLWRREYGAAVASSIARRMVVPPHRDGGQAQFITAPLPAVADDDMARVQAWAVAHLHEDLAVATMAAYARMSERTFARRFAEACGASPGAWVAQRRLERACELLERTNLPVEAVAERVGWGTAAVLRHHFARLRTTPNAYRRAFSRIDHRAPEFAG